MNAISFLSTSREEFNIHTCTHITDIDFSTVNVHVLRYSCIVYEIKHKCINAILHEVSCSFTAIWSNAIHLYACDIACVYRTLYTCVVEQMCWQQWPSKSLEALLVASICLPTVKCSPSTMVTPTST